LSDKKIDTWMPVDVMHTSLWALPRAAGVYAIFFDGELVYVGQSSDLGARLVRHRFQYGYAKNIHTPWGSFPDSIKLTAKVKLSRVVGDWAMWEIRLIRRLKPRFNRVMLRARAA
jgi:excinuclease UvrABC nuclease subunit